MCLVSVPTRHLVAIGWPPILPLSSLTSRHLSIILARFQEKLLLGSYETLDNLRATPFSGTMEGGGVRGETRGDASLSVIGQGPAPRPALCRVRRLHPPVRGANDATQWACLGCTAGYAAYSIPYRLAHYLSTGASKSERKSRFLSPAVKVLWEDGSLGYLVMPMESIVSHKVCHHASDNTMTRGL